MYPSKNQIGQKQNHKKFTQNPEPCHFDNWERPSEAYAGTSGTHRIADWSKPWDHESIKYESTEKAKKAFVKSKNYDSESNSDIDDGPSTSEKNNYNEKDVFGKLDDDKEHDWEPKNNSVKLEVNWLPAKRWDESSEDDSEQNDQFSRSLEALKQEEQEEYYNSWDEESNDEEEKIRNPNKKLRDSAPTNKNSAPNNRCIRWDESSEDDSGLNDQYLRDLEAMKQKKHKEYYNSWDEESDDEKRKKRNPDKKLKDLGYTKQKEKQEKIVVSEVQPRLSNFPRFVVPVVGKMPVKKSEVEKSMAKMSFENPEKSELKVERTKADEAKSGDKIGLQNSKTLDIKTQETSKAEKEETKVPRKSLESSKEPKYMKQKKETTQVSENEGTSTIEEKKPGIFSSFLLDRPIFEARSFEDLSQPTTSTATLSNEQVSFENPIGVFMAGISNRRPDRRERRRLKKQKAEEVKRLPDEEFEELCRLHALETEKNVFSQFYAKKWPRQLRKPKNREISNFKHSEGAEFAAKSYFWDNNWDFDLPELPKPEQMIMPLPTSTPDVYDDFAFYRVLMEKEDKYILVACHANVHGFHRGDLRFLEINSRSRLNRLEGQSVIGSLFLGDIVAVTELARNSEAISPVRDVDVSLVTPDTSCYWIVSKMILYPRNVDKKSPVLFSIVNRMAAIKGENEPMNLNVDNWDMMHADSIYTGLTFRPETLEYHFSKDYQKKKINELVVSARTIRSYPGIYGTIFKFKEGDHREEFKKEMHLNTYTDVSSPETTEPANASSESSSRVPTPIQKPECPKPSYFSAYAYTSNRSESPAYVNPFGVLNSDFIAEVEEKTEEEKIKETEESKELKRLAELEHEKNVFSQYYQKKSGNRRENHRGRKSPQIPKTRKPSSCKHHEAIEFAAKSNLWDNNWDKDLPMLPRSQEIIMPLPASAPAQTEVCGLYRVLMEKNDKYILIACHVNVHGYHRGDLRFLEVNSRSRLKGLSEQSVIGSLFLGDIVAVTELARNSNAQSSVRDVKVSSVTQETRCYWIVSNMILYPRILKPDVTFSFLKNRMAVVKGEDEPMRVNCDDWKTVAPDLIYTGMAFSPIKLDDNFSDDFQRKSKNLLISNVLKISSYPNAFGIIYSYEECSEQNEEFKIGTKAYSDTLEIHKYKRERIVETCSLMGFSAANTIFNGRFDCRAFHMYDVSKEGPTVRFRIENPRNRPTLGLWNNGNKILIGGPTGDTNGTIETVMCNSSHMGWLKIAARLTRECPKDFRFNGDLFVSQREPKDHYYLYDGYFQDMAPESNGRKIIETLYGGKPLELRTGDVGGEYFFPSTPEPIRLNVFQKEYVQMLLDGNPLVIGSSPFGCGKSMTIITAALEIYKRNAERNLVGKTHQLLITQSNFASVNLIEIARKTCNSGDEKLRNMKFMRFITDKNWNEQPDHGRTKFDMPFLMNKVFKQWAIGELDGNELMTHHTKSMIAHIIRNGTVTVDELCSAARRVFDKYGDCKIPFSGHLTEAFFILYEPDLIMTTADSSKSVCTLLDKKYETNKNECTTVQIDEASQLPEYTLLGLLKTYNKANFGLIGDIHQLPPFCMEELEGRLKEFGIGNTMERAIQNKLFPISNLRYVYRCHPQTTALLSELFYDGKLISGVTESQRNEFMIKRKDFWPNPSYPVMIINHMGTCQRMGTSAQNHSEKDLVSYMVQNLLDQRKYTLKPQDIGVISFYAAQTSLLTEQLRRSGVKCGTVDAFQGSEKEVIILCCTNEHATEFMQCKFRLNVALSRAKQATVIVGNLGYLRKAKYWNAIVKRVEAYGNLRQSDDKNLFNSRQAYVSTSSSYVKNPFYMHDPYNRNAPVESVLNYPTGQRQKNHKRRNETRQQQDDNAMSGRWDNNSWSYYNNGYR
ncbi:hypothetical protein L3Y34_016844 [Caenorhabditis briggsae]|uniref:DNA2/NAM7 helicase-like C-terminal domain-containing protein n=1 Tax=Caenorhabditis briggsae TaxID=6238 RepID=A0AAE9IT26_CAEBR|nr:hypothetical protein L3Y34_016844 [Caenorhabditis briggsae]